MPMFGKAKVSKFNTLYFYSDGGLRVAPPAASSAVVVKNRQGQVIEWISRVLPPLTSMEAEYHGLLDALAVAARLGPAKAFFHLDNQAVVGQVTGRFQVREARLKLLHQKALAAIGELNHENIKFEFYYVPREYNLLADALAADALLILPEPHPFNRPSVSLENKQYNLNKNER